MSNTEVIALALAIAALVLVVVELARQRRYVLAWAVLLLAIAQVIVRI